MPEIERGGEELPRLSPGVGCDSTAQGNKVTKYESTSYLCTLFDIQCCQSVIRKLVYGFMCRLDSSVNCIIKGILATSLRYTSRIRKHWCSLLYINS